MILFKNKTWEIEKINNKQITISNGDNLATAFLTKKSYFDKQIELQKFGETNDYQLSVDFIIFPKYIEQKALKKAIKNIELLT